MSYDPAGDIALIRREAGQMVSHEMPFDAAALRLAGEVERARAELDDYRHMPCEECLTFAPGPEFAHLKAEKDAYMERTFKAEAEVERLRVEAVERQKLVRAWQRRLSADQLAFCVTSEPVVAAALAWVGRIDRTTNIGAWADREDFALVDAVDMYRAGRTE